MQGLHCNQRAHWRSLLHSGYLERGHLAFHATEVRHTIRSDREDITPPH